MGFFHLANCLALATGPHLLVYKSTGMRENEAFWSCCKIACLYALTQMLKFFLVTLTPHYYLSSILDSTTFDVFGVILEIIVISMIVRGSLCRNEFGVIASSLGWSISSLVATKYVLIWVGTRGLEFDWSYLCLSYEANLDLVDTFVVFYAIWLLSRRSGPAWSTSLGLIVIISAPVKSVFFTFSRKIESTVVALLMRTVICVVLGITTIILRSQRHADRAESQGLSTLIRMLQQLTAGRHPFTYKSRDSKSNPSVFIKSVK
ncbi:unnamed protein product [Heterobilharzia americana]|nr:unnamed protein product [Heterobilharzia americana]CAH8437760.1 unnamed protein product [Heterobilharzia americana]